MGDTTALESESMVVDVMFLLRNGLLAAGRLEAVAGAMLLDLDGSIGQRRGTPCSEDDDRGKSAVWRLETRRWELRRLAVSHTVKEEPRSTTGEEERREGVWGYKTEKKPRSSFHLSRGLEKIRMQWVLVSRGSILCDLLGRGRCFGTPPADTYKTVETKDGRTQHLAQTDSEQGTQPTRA
jgi:hypothetical protein